MNEEEADFWKNLFFYIVSFIGLMIFIFSIVSFISGFFNVSYPVYPVSNIHIDVRSLIDNGTATVVGFFMWFFTWRTIQKERNIT